MRDYLYKNVKIISDLISISSWSHPLRAPDTKKEGYLKKSNILNTYKYILVRLILSLLGLQNK